MIAKHSVAVAPSFHGILAKRRVTANTGIRIRKRIARTWYQGRLTAS